MNTFCTVYVATDLYLVFWMHKKTQRKQKEKKKNGENNTGATLLPMNQKACIPHCHQLTK